MRSATERRTRDEVVSPVGAPPITSALRDLFLVTAVVWVSVFLVHNYDLPQAIAEWNRAHEEWAMDEVTMILIAVVAALGVFAWRRWRELLRVFAHDKAMLQQLLTSEAQKGQLINSVSHELRTPLTAILGYAEMIQQNELDEVERQAMVDRIVSQGWDLACIVEDLLTQARTESQTLSVASVPVLLGAQTSEVLEGLNPADLERIHIDPGNPVRAVGDPARVRQIIRNLVTNAIHHGGPNVGIATHQTTGMAHLAVYDDGPSIPARESELIFEPYHRLSDAGVAPGGLGLGLSISRSLARLMSGDLVYQRRGDESVFLLSLPLAPEVTHPGLGGASGDRP
jgi:signal transduction histidine kinase